MKLIFFCGHKSPYGIAHLEPILRSNFNVIEVIFATNKRWKTFSEKLSGETHYLSKNRSFIRKLKKNSRRIIKKLLFFFPFINLGIKKKINIFSLLREYNVPFCYSDDVNSGNFIQKIRIKKPDLIFCAAYPQIFSDALLSVPKMGAVNFHPSLLPQYRGAHPHYWVLVKGEKESGLTAHFMTKEIDKGDLIAQIKFNIINYNYENLYKKIVSETPRLIEKVEELFFKGKFTPLKQDSSKSSYFRNDREIHHRIQWNIHSAEDIFNLVRGGYAFCFFRNRKVIIVECSVTEGNKNLTNDVTVENGIIVDLDSAIAVKTKLDIINITKLKFYNKKKLNFRKFIIKHNLLIGERFD